MQEQPEVGDDSDLPPKTKKFMENLDEASRESLDRMAMD
jgi:hypothetical protein